VIEPTVRFKLLDFLARYWLSVCFFVFTAFLCKPAWWDGLLFGFRDTLHFYYPLWSHIDRLPWTEQLLPLWNPLDGFGCSIVGEPTSMVFYPFRVFLILPVGSIEQRIGVFILIHIWLCYSLWIFAGSKLGLQSWALQLTAWGYSLSGPVFFQIYNPPFLVGAAWLPLAMFGILKSVKASWNTSDATSLLPAFFESLRDRQDAIVCLSVSLAMIVLGGDAQLAYHLAIITVMVICCLLLQIRWSNQLSSYGCWKLFLIATSSIFISFTLAVGLSAVQSIPTRYWLELSERTGPIDVGSENNVRNLLGAPYLFSEAPWNYSTALVSNVLGHISPGTTRWLVPFGAEPSIWTPSLHVGTLVIAAAIAWWFTRLRTSLSVVTIVVTFIAILSSIGRYNLYEVWNTILPGYSQFRYPAKWTPFFAWGVCMAATEGISHIHDANIRRIVQRICCIIAVLGGAAACFNLLVYFSPTARITFYDLLTDSAKTRGIERDLDLSQSIYFIGFGGFLALFTAASIYVALQWRDSSRSRFAIGCITVIELSIALQPALIFVRPLSVDPLPGLPTETSTSWRHFTDSESTRQAKEVLSQRGLKTTWQFGGMTIPVLRSRDIPVARVLNTPWDACELQAVDQGNSVMGKLHLLRNVRNFQAYFTLGPKAIRRFCATLPIDLEAETPTPQSASDQYLTHHIWPLNESPTWPPRDRPNPLEERIQFSKAMMESNRFEFDYESPEGFYLQLPILDDGGWYTARTDIGVSIIKGPEDLLTLRLPSGSHSIALRFFPPGLLLGAIISGCSLAIIAMQVCRFRSEWHSIREKRLQGDVLS
jgi:hypothetical protein